MAPLAHSFATIGLVCCAVVNHGSSPVVFEQSLRHAYCSRQKTLTEPRPPIQLKAEQEISNCRDYLSALWDDNVSPSLEKHRRSSEYRICELVDAISRSGKGDFAITEDPSLGKDLARRLDLRTFRSSFRPRVSDNEFTLTHLDPEGLTINQRGVIASARDWYFSVRVVAVIDINDNKKADWVLAVDDEARKGTYRSYEVLIARDVPAEGPIEARDYGATR